MIRILAWADHSWSYIEGRWLREGVDMARLAGDAHLFISALWSTMVDMGHEPGQSTEVKDAFGEVTHHQTVSVYDTMQRLDEVLLVPLRADTETWGMDPAAQAAYDAMLALAGGPAPGWSPDA